MTESMNQIPDHKNKEIIMAAIKQNVWHRLPNEFKSETLVEMVKQAVSIWYIFPDTILRYMRLLKADGQINYVCENRKLRIYKKMKINSIKTKTIK